MESPTYHIRSVMIKERQRKLNTESQIAAGVESWNFPSKKTWNYQEVVQQQYGKRFWISKIVFFWSVSVWDWYMLSTLRCDTLTERWPIRNYTKCFFEMDHFFSQSNVGMKRDWMLQNRFVGMFPVKIKNHYSTFLHGLQELQLMRK